MAFMLFSSSIDEGVLLLSFILYRNPDKYVCYLNPENYPAEDRPRSNCMAKYFWSTSIQCLGKREKILTGQLLFSLQLILFIPVALSV